MSYLRIEGLTKDFGGYRAVDGLTLTIEKGEFVSLLGPSGCGKTTTLQMIAGFVEPSSGVVVLDGKNLLAVPPYRRGLGIVFQSYALFPHMTAAENVAFGLEMAGVGRDERRRRAGEMLDLVGLGGFADRFPRRMSGGQQQRVALARALAIRPGILLLDEPLSNLDAKLREGMQVELREIQRKLGTTTVLVTHDQAEAMALSDRIVVMNKGRAEQIGPPEDSYERPATAFVADFLGRTNTLRAQADENGTVRLCDVPLPIAKRPPGPLSLSIRPEKIGFSAAGTGLLDAVVTARIFQGTQWLYQLKTPAGAVVAIRQNDGGAGPIEGARIGLSWAAEHCLVDVGARDAS
ncbi:MAG: ABC transporter ATP-binding protein [Chelatococcus sp.]|nr:MAG: ABC transporter ATP-binding protein [Chelatococcus sp.]